VADLTKRKRRLGMKKRIFAMLMAAAMMLSMAACGNGKERGKKKMSKKEIGIYIIKKILLFLASIFCCQ
jgi:hypothetical protein